MDNSGALNAYLIPVNSPYAQNSGQTSGYEFGYQNEDGGVTSAQIADASIGSAKIQNASIGNAQLGTAVIGTANIGTITFNQISGGTIEVVAPIGGTATSGSIYLDGGNNRIIVNDGTVDRILIGFQAGGF